jgi:surface polysaccharide O-acyltransferase-like enzyme
MIAGLYFIIPLLKIFVNYCEKRLFEYILIIIFIFTSILPIVEKIFAIKIGFYLPINSVYVFYLLLGHYIHNYKIIIKNKMLFLLMVLYFCCAIFMPINNNFVNLTGGGNIVFFGYNSPIVVMSTVALFCFVHQKNKSAKIFNLLSPMCFGIYLIHTLFLNILYKFIKFTPEKYPLIIVIIGATSITIMFSIGFTYIARKINIVKKYIL